MNRQSGGDRSVITYARQSLTVSAAAQRARAGDRTAARRLAWRLLVLRRRRHAEWLLSRYKALDAQVARLRREPSHPDCAACFVRAERIRGLREEYLAELASLPGSVPTYAASREIDFFAVAKDNYWFRSELENLGKGLTRGAARSVAERGRTFKVLVGGRA